MNQTHNYNLSQWEKSDRVLMEDFNADNAKIDAALKAEADARAEADTSLSNRVARLGNCRIWTTTYTGDGTRGPESCCTVTFPKKPVLVFIVGVGGAPITFMSPNMTAGQYYGYTRSNYGYALQTTWTENTVSWWCGGTAEEQFNSENAVYYVVALIAADQ